MRLSLLDHICCWACASDLAFHGPTESGKITGEIKEGVLTCTSCHRWYPVPDYIPEILPDHLRDPERDRALLENMKPILPGNILKGIRDQRIGESGESGETPAQDAGAHYKKAEMGIKDKITDPHFFGPGGTLPFNPGDTGYSVRLLHRIGNLLPLLAPEKGTIVVDTGVGYGWTTEWLAQMGLETIGVDICRTYLDIGYKRMERVLRVVPQRPHLLVADSEHLPLKDGFASGVLCFDSFHHIPDRPRAMGHFCRLLKTGGRVVLAEPGGAHEFAGISRDVTEQYGLLEKGMELDDVRHYCSGLDVFPPRQHYVLDLRHDEQNKTLSADFLATHSTMDCNVFVVEKSDNAVHLNSRSHELKYKFKQKLRRWFKRILMRIFG